MKRYIFLILTIILTISLFGQSGGDGSQANPYYGTITSPVTWVSGRIIYIGANRLNSDVTVRGSGILTIQPGVTIFFTQPNSNLRINDTGILRANGTRTQPIRFTAEEGSTWGHIAFTLNSTGTSNLTYCIIENGNASNRDQYKGGGIYANNNNLTISGCIIRNCSADAAGGGIYTSLSPKIENCLIYDNECWGFQMGEGGGGVYIDAGSSANLTNCTIANNIIWDDSGEARGDDVYIGSASAVIKNTIIWRELVNFYSVYFSINPAASSLTNCAIIGAYNSSTNEIDVTSFNSSIKINTSNTAPDGPNFLSPTTDLSISPFSACRDRGTSSATPGTAPPLTDFMGSSRVGPYDIGAYEVQYIRWRTSASSTDWNTASNWDGGVPGSTSNVIIPAGATNYPVLSPGPDFTIGSGRYLIIESGASTTLNALTNNGTIALFNDASTSASLILNSYTRGAGGTEKIQVLLIGGEAAVGEDTYRWHFISTPVSSLPVSTFTGVTQDIFQYVESRTYMSLLYGWVAYDGFVYGGGAGQAFSVLEPGKGYDYYAEDDNTFTFSGLFNTSDVNASLSFTLPQGPAPRGFNLLGNPFHSGLDWDYIIDDPSYPANTSKALYFTRNNVQCTYAGGVGTPGDVTGIIPPMQGFFNKTYSAGNSIALPTAARTHNNIHSRYKGEEIIPLVRLGITENSFSDEMVVRFDENAKPDLDYDFDAVKMSVSESHPYLYSVSSGTNYAINGQPFPEEVTEFPIVVNSPTDGSHKIIAKQIQGLDSYYIALTDKTTGYSADLKKTPWLSFIAPKGKITDRFVLKVSTVPTGIENPTMTDGKFNIYQAYDFIMIEPLDEIWNGKTGDIRIMDLTGKSVSGHSNIEFQSKSLIQIPAPERKGIYFVEIRSGKLRHTGKVVIR